MCLHLFINHDSLAGLLAGAEAAGANKAEAGAADTKAVGDAANGDVGDDAKAGAADVETAEAGAGAGAGADDAQTEAAKIGPLETSTSEKQTSGTGLPPLFLRAAGLVGWECPQEPLLLSSSSSDPRSDPSTSGSFSGSDLLNVISLDASHVDERVIF